METCFQFKNKKRFVMRPLFITVAALSIVSTELHAQQSYTPPPLPNKDVDSFGVELKTGRYIRQSPEVISVGSGDEALSISFPGQDRDSSFLHQYTGSVSSPDPNIIVVRYGYNFETFAKGSDYNSTKTIVQFSPQILSGSSLRRTYDGSKYQYTFATKNGTKYVFGSNPDRTVEASLIKISYASGYEIYISSFAISNNKGFAVKAYVENSTGIISWQAVNQSIDTCDTAANALCKTSYSRIGKTFNSSESQSTADRNFVTPTGEVTIFRYSPMEVAHYPNGYEYIQLPTAVDLPGGSKNEVTISYNYPTVATRNADDVMVTQVTTGGLTSKYSYVKDLINTGGNASRGFQLKTSGEVDGVKRFDATSITPPFSSASQARTPSTMLTYKDANSNVTTFKSDRFGRISGATFPKGNFVSNTADDRNNYTQTDQGAPSVPNLTSSRTFPTDCSAMDQPACNQPKTSTDPRNAVISYEYNDRGQIKTISYPAGVGNSSGATTSYFYTLRTAFKKSSTGGIVAAGPEISLLDYTSTCIKTVPCDGQPDQVVTRYDYGPTDGANNLNLRGISITGKDSDGVVRTRLTCYTYNYFGDRVSEIKPRAGVAKCG